MPESFLIKLQASVLKPATLLKTETPVQVSSCEFCGIFKNNFFIEHLRWLLLHACYEISFLIGLRTRKERASHYRANLVKVTRGDTHI